MEQPAPKVGSLEELTANTASLISLPEIYLKFKQLMDDEASDIQDFARVVTMDPNLTGVVLKVINSPLYGFSGQIHAIDRAINLMGLGQLHDLVLALSAVDAIRIGNDIEQIKTFWQRSIYCGVMARLLAQHLNLRDPAGLFVIGLLHEIGRILVFIKHPEAARAAIIDARQHACPLASSEGRIFGYHYGDIGAQLMADWNLPVKFHTVIGLHLDPIRSSEHYAEAALLGLSHKMATFARPGIEPYHYTEGELGLDHLKIDAADLEALLPEVEKLSIEMESMIIKN
ncbi:HDOD domain-containing protein [Halioxenophilus aromaticivorans]